ncbi:exported hypothetical protein [Candidatus Sulfobium mesophilum]|uniref:Bacterial Ig domain-containing protein n=1 Tax=Candidatus Sulfobium mesophilum TaxID=2016548 RepID=A0A2U3QEX8_9BACT|nr:exported hypothetical protein [Candidatus Sulfobium mesophilum]
MKRERRLVRIVAVAVLVLLVALPAISWAGAPDVVTVEFAIFAQAKGKWSVKGTAAPGKKVTVQLGRSVVGTSAPTAANGNWMLSVSGSAVVANSGDSITATSSGGGSASQAVLIR